ncbi:adenosylcobyric acid synthase [Candidatus Hakubella thermalkaliphila]|uniref:Cobyric acid synthase n=1 Tax=Candidatus Hakubella thermalkaliphila TaxID=2754717 RepID=A0A6V8NRI4_9ACTN|nr:adenosylcobyric acid synthase [Candidatus Hakubella thermalkaliphila]
MLAKTLMIQGTCSHVGKSVIVAALCRIFKQDGIRVAPFKSQNMALNSYVTKEGLEMGRAQVVQAQAAGLDPVVEMNPILLKPSADKVAQVIVMGRPIGNMSAVNYHQYKPFLLDTVAKALEKLREEYELVIIEGAGSPAEINLADRDIANMRIAEMADAPVILVGDVDRGGVFAFLVGTLELLSSTERARIRGFLINKFRGDVGLLEPGLAWLEDKTKVPVVGVIPYYRELGLEEEDSVSLENFIGRQLLNASLTPNDNVDIAVIYLPHISNFTDFDALSREKGVHLRYVASPESFGSPDLIIIPGSKSTISDLGYLKNTGLAELIIQAAEKAMPVIGICGGYQMLGRKIRDPHHAESNQEEMEGLGLLDVETVFSAEKTTSQVTFQIIGGWPPLLPKMVDLPKMMEEPGYLSGDRKVPLEGYEIHMGTTRRGPGASPLFKIKRKGEERELEDGAVNQNGLVWGTYVHGIFDNDVFRRALIQFLKERKGLRSEPLSAARAEDRLSWGRDKEESYDRWAEVVRQSVRMGLLYGLTSLKPRWS